MDHEFETYYLKDFIYFAFKAWRKIIVFTVLGAILFSGLAIGRNYIAQQNLDKGIKDEDETIKLSEEELKDIHNKAISEDVYLIKYNKRIEFLSSRIDQLIERLSNSVYLNLENDIVQDSFNLFIHTENVTNEEKTIFEQKSLLLSQEYLRLIKDNSFYTQLEKDNNSLITGANLRELIKIQMEPNNSLRIEIIGPDKETVHCLNESAQEYILQEAEKQSSYSYPHKLSIENETFNIINDPSIARKRIRMEEEIKNSTDELEQLTIEYDLYLEDAMEIEIQNYIQEKIEEKNDDVPEEEDQEKKTPKKISLPLYVIGGTIVGIMIALLWNFYRGSTTNKLLHPKDFATRTGLLYINENFIPKSDGQIKDKKFGAGLDNWLERQYLKPKIKKTAVLEDSIGYANTVISGLVEAREEAQFSEKDMSKIAVFGSKDKAVQDVFNLLEKKSKEAAQQFEYALIDSNFDTVSAIDTLRESDSALILAQPRQTNIKDLLRSLELAQQLKKPILGLISVEKLI